MNNKYYRIDAIQNAFKKFLIELTNEYSIGDFKRFKEFLEEDSFVLSNMELIERKNK